MREGMAFGCLKTGKPGGGVAPAPRDLRSFIRIISLVTLKQERWDGGILVLFLLCAIKMKRLGVQLSFEFLAHPLTSDQRNKSRAAEECTAEEFRLISVHQKLAGPCRGVSVLSAVDDHF